MATKAKAPAVQKKGDAPEDADQVVIEVREDQALVVKKAEFIDAIVEKYGLKKRDVKPAAEAVIEMLGEVLSEGKDLNLPPVGKIKMINQKTLGDGSTALTLKLRLKKQSEAEPEF